MKAYVFPGQGSQFVGMGKELFDSSALAKALFQEAGKILGFDITEVMFDGDDEALKATRITQPAIFLHSVILAKSLGDSFRPDFVAGHSLGEFSALVAANALDFASGLRLVAERAEAMQAACDITQGAMAAILGLEDGVVEEVCGKITGVVVAANYNCPGQLVISGELAAVDAACAALTDAGAKRALRLPVGGAFHSPLMEPARTRLAAAIENTEIRSPHCPIYQNVTAQATADAETIKLNLIKQLTAPVRWTQTMQQMIADGCTEVIEVGPGKVLQGLFKKVDRALETASAEVI